MRTANSKVLVVILTLIAALAVACASEAPAPVPAEEIAAMVNEAVKEAVAGAAPAAFDPKEIQTIVDAAIMEAAAAKVLVEGAPKAPDVRYVANEQVPGEYYNFLYDGPRPTTFNESPLLTKLVKSGGLPPVEERLPVAADVLVIPAPDEIGVYGGTYRITARGRGNVSTFGGKILQESADGKTMLPYLVKSWTVSDDGRVNTYKLRQGAKWSDGTPFTTEDFRFAYEDINLDPDIGRPISCAQCRDPITGTPYQFQLIDKYTFTYTFDSPQFAWINADGWGSANYGGSGFSWYAPAHYLKQFHKKYADAAQLAALIKEEGAEDWVALWKKKAQYRGEESLGAPFMGPYTLCEWGDTSSRLCRNPYFFAVDPEGNQLPYIDNVFFKDVGSDDVAILRALIGETDTMGGSTIRLTNLPLFLKNMERGDYSLYHWPAWTPDGIFSFNQTYNVDPEIGRMIRTQDFRIALSIALDRDEIHETVWLGLGVNQNLVPRPDEPYFPGAKYVKLDMIYDVARANKLLDGLGLKDTDGDGVRNRVGDLDGNKGNFELFMEIQDAAVPMVNIIQDNWAAVGIKLDFKVNPRFRDRVRGNELYFMLNVTPGPDPLTPWWANALIYTPTKGNSQNGPLIGLCIQTKGEKGMCKDDVDPTYLPLAPKGNYPADPFGHLAKMHDLYMEGMAHREYSPRRIEIAKEMSRILTEQKYMMAINIGGGSNRGLFLKRNNLRNVPRQAWATRAVGTWPQVYYFEDGIDNMNNPGTRSRRYDSENLIKFAE